MATMERRIRHTTMGEAMPETTPRGVDPDSPCAVVREGEMFTVIPYSLGFAETLGPDGLDREVNRLADEAFEGLTAAT